MPCLVSIHLVALEEKLLPVGCVASLALLHGPGWGTALLNATGSRISLDTHGQAQGQLPSPREGMFKRLSKAA